MKRTKLLVIAGGVSAEHEVSLVSATSLIKELAGSEIDPHILVISRAGHWLSPAESAQALKQGSSCTGSVSMTDGCQQLKNYDLIFPLIHGTTGEDGRLQGLLEFMGIPYIGSGVLASALCMDKAMTKTVLRAAKVPCLDWHLLTSAHYENAATAVLNQCTALGKSWFVKPANQGSSIGISKASSRSELKQSIETALRYDRRVLVEPAIETVREFEVSVLGNHQPETSPAGEIRYNAQFYNYKSKYTSGHSSLVIPADINTPLSDHLQDLALRAYQELDCAGFARIDFLYDEANDEVYVSEVNTLPGFTPFSMFTKLLEAKGLAYLEIITRLVALAKERHAEIQAHRQS